MASLEEIKKRYPSASTARRLAFQASFQMARDMMDLLDHVDQLETYVKCLESEVGAKKNA